MPTSACRSAAVAAALAGTRVAIASLPPILVRMAPPPSPASQSPAAIASASAQTCVSVSPHADASASEITARCSAGHPPSSASGMAGKVPWAANTMSVRPS